MINSLFELHMQLHKSLVIFPKQSMMFRGSCMNTVQPHALSKLRALSALWMIATVASKVGRDEHTDSKNHTEQYRSDYNQ